jgi:poly(A) polymerase
MQALKKEDCTVIPTGLQHGTATVVVNSSTFEVTALRKDVKTDGRHATIAFTNDWKEDAARRDFTINALYLDKHGSVYDFFDGLADLHNRTVRFIGAPEQRIREDFLRILRYYRFFIRFGKNVDKQSFWATTKLRWGLTSLSRERIQAELFKIIGSPLPVIVINTMNYYGILREIFASDASFYKFPEIVTLTNYFEPNEELLKMIRLFFLYPRSNNFFKYYLRLSKRQLFILKIFNEVYKWDFSYESLFRVNYIYGQDIANAFLQIKCACYSDPIRIYKKLRKEIHAIDQPFPLQGDDILAHGIYGQRVGTLLSLCKNWWIDGRGKANKEECLDFLKKYL